MSKIDACTTWLFDTVLTLLKMLQVYQGEAYANMSPQNKLRYGYGMLGDRMMCSHPVACVR